jgi:hypothetical protein
MRQLPKVSKAQRQNLRVLLNDVKTAIAIPLAETDFSNLQVSVSTAIRDRTLTKAEFSTIRAEVRAIVKSAGIPSEDAQLIASDLQQIAVEAQLTKPTAISETQKQTIRTLINDLNNSIDTPPSETAVAELKSGIRAAFSDRTISQPEFQTIVTDVIELVEATGVTPEEARILFYDLQNIAETSRLPRTNDNLVGTDTADILWSGLGNDTLIGTTANAGVNEVDILCGGGGNDRFQLGNATTVFYDDGNSLTPGLGDYAMILDFNPNQDTIQLKGDASQYQLSTLPASLGLTGTGIYYTLSGSTPELIGITVGVTLTDTTRFTFI